MYAIQSQRPKSAQKVSANILPCQIQHSGPVNAERRYWNPVTDDKGHQTAYFRGRKLKGRNLGIPEGYKGVVLKQTQQVLQQMAPETLLLEADRHAGECDELEMNDDIDEKVECKLMEEVATFDSVTIWGHETLLENTEDPHVKGIREWISFAQELHSYDTGRSIKSIGGV